MKKTVFLFVLGTIFFAFGAQDSNAQSSEQAVYSYTGSECGGAEQLLKLNTSGYQNQVMMKKADDKEWTACEITGLSTTDGSTTWTFSKKNETYSLVEEKSNPSAMTVYNQDRSKSFKYVLKAKKENKEHSNSGGCN